jgi:hypothetical protein
MRTDDELHAELEIVQWTKSTLSGPNGGDCLYAAKLSGDRYAIKDSEQPDAPPDDPAWRRLPGLRGWRETR